MKHDPVNVLVSSGWFRVIETFAEIHLIPIRTDFKYVIVCDKSSRTYKMYKKELYDE